MLVALTVLTGLVDAVSYLALGHVFVANMTGNVVILGFAIAERNRFSVPASLTALVLLRSRVDRMRRRAELRASGHASRTVAGDFDRRATRADRRRRRSSQPSLGQPQRQAQDTQTSGTPKYLLIALLAVAMGVQNAVVRKLAVPDLTTTVLTLTTTGIFADAKFVGGPGSKAGRRAVSLIAMFLGALCGALLLLRVSAWVALLPAVAIAAGVSVTAALAGRGEPDWTRSTGH